MKISAASLSASLIAGSIAFWPAHGGESTTSPTLKLEPCRVAGVEETLRCGTLNVPENRQTNRGRQLPLKVIVMPARKPGGGKGPVYFFAGGPGQAATEYTAMFADLAVRDEHDIVLFDERGRGEGHALRCKLPVSDADPQSYFAQPYTAANARSCRKQLETKADLTQYGTWNSVEDIEAMRRALGHGRINLEGGSGGTYTALMYIKKYSKNVRTAFLYSLFPPENRLPLYHASAAQSALEELFRQCERDIPCRTTFPNFRQDVRDVLARARKAPLRVLLKDETGKPVPITLDYDTVADALRVMMYDGGRRVPFVFREAKTGNYARLAEVALADNRSFYGGVRLGLQLAITCNEFTNRIRPGEAAKETRGSYLGDARVRAQQAACSEWPKTSMPAGIHAPFQSNVPTVMVSGRTDPVIGPQWHKIFQKYLPNSVHLLIPGGHTPFNECSEKISLQLFSQGSIEGIDTSCAATSPARPFVLNKKDYLQEGPPPG